MTAILEPVRRVYDWKVHGLRWVNLIGLVLVAAMILSVYVAKTAAAREGAKIAEIERSIEENQRRVRLLRAEVARLEQPGRLEALSRQAGLAPVDVHRRATPNALPTLQPVAPAHVVQDTVEDVAPATSAGEAGQ